MSNYIRIPNRAIQSLKTRNKLTLIVVYAYIRSQIKDSTNTASISEQELAEKCGVCLRSVGNYIQELKKEGLITVIDKKQGKSEYPYNVYRVEFPEEDFSMIKPELLTDSSLTTEQKGLLILLKSHCHEGTNHMNYPSANKIAPLLNIGRIKLGDMIKELLTTGHLLQIQQFLIIIDPNILMFLNPTSDNLAYETIYAFCLLNGAVPPIRGDRRTYTNNIYRILESYPTPPLLSKALQERFINIPPNVSLGYFCEGLCNKHYSKEKKTKHEFIL